MRHRRLPRAVDHRLPAGGPRAQAGVRRRQPPDPRQARGADAPLRGGRRLRRRGPRSLQRGGGVRQRRRARHVSQAAAPELRGVRRGPLLHARHRQRSARAVRHRRRQGRDLDLRGHLEPVRSTRDAIGRWCRAEHQHQRLAVPLAQGPRARADDRDPGGRRVERDRVRQPGRRPGRVGVRRRIARVRRRGEPARPGAAVRRAADDRRRADPARSIASACSIRAGGAPRSSCRWCT